MNKPAPTESDDDDSEISAKPLVVVPSDDDEEEVTDSEPLMPRPKKFTKYDVDDDEDDDEEDEEEEEKKETTPEETKDIDYDSDETIAIENVVPMKMAVKDSSDVTDDESDHSQPIKHKFKSDLNTSEDEDDDETIMNISISKSMENIDELRIISNNGDLNEGISKGEKCNIEEIIGEHNKESEEDILSSNLTPNINEPDEHVCLTEQDNMDNNIDNQPISNSNNDLEQFHDGNRGENVVNNLAMDLNNDQREQICLTEQDNVDNIDNNNVDDPPISSSNNEPEEVNSENIIGANDATIVVLNDFSNTDRQEPDDNDNIDNVATGEDDNSETDSLSQSSLGNFMSILKTISLDMTTRTFCPIILHLQSYNHLHGKPVTYLLH